MSDKIPFETDFDEDSSSVALGRELLNLHEL